MLTRRFNELFMKLVARWTDWRDAPRSPEQVPALERARFALEDARTAISVEREVIAAVQPEGARTSVSEADRARLRVFATGYLQN